MCEDTLVILGSGTDAGVPDALDDVAMVTAKLKAPL